MPHAVSRATCIQRSTSCWQPAARRNLPTSTPSTADSATVRSTYWLLDTLKQQGPAPTFQMIHDRVVAKIHETFPAQTSVLIGDPGRVAFQDLRIEPAFTIPVAGVDLGAQQLTLSAGLSAGLAKGAEFVIYPRTETDLSQIETRRAWVRLTNVRDSESDAEIVEQFGDQVPEAGDPAVLVGAASQALVRNVRIVRRDLKPLTDEDTALLAIKKALPGNGWVELVETQEQSASFVVRLSEDGAHYEICTPDYEPIRLNPPLAVADEHSPQALLRRLVHLTKYQAVLELETNAPSAPLQKKLGIELLALPDDFKADEYPWPEPQPFQEPVPTIRPGQWVCLRITNRSSRPVNVAVLDLQPAWGIAQAYPPDSDFEELDSGGEPLVIPLKASLPEGYATGVDTLKVLATVKPTSFRQLTLPRLDQPIPNCAVGGRPKTRYRERCPGATAGCRGSGTAAEPRRLRPLHARPGVGLRQGAGANRGEAEVNKLRQEPRPSPAAHPTAPDHQVVPKRRRFSGRSDMVGPVNQAPEKMGPTRQEMCRSGYNS